MKGCCFISVRCVKLLYISVLSPGIYTLPQDVHLSGRVSHLLHVHPAVPGCPVSTFTEQWMFVVTV